MKKGKIVQATQIDNEIQAVVEFEDGFRQTVQLKDWATKQNILDEATRLRQDVEGREQRKQERADLVD